MAASAHDYISRRNRTWNTFSWGLHRRTAKIVESIREVVFRYGPRNQPVDIVDFGCAEGAMLYAIKENLGPLFHSGLGIDSFSESSIPDNDPASSIRFFRHGFGRTDEELDRLPDEYHGIAHIAIASAFLKHVRNPQNFLRELEKVLLPGGYAIIVDPSIWVVRLGRYAGRFLHTLPSLWDKETVQRWLTEHKIGLDIMSYEKYFAAPYAVEPFLPRRWTNAFGLHQCIILRKP